MGVPFKDHIHVPEAHHPLMGVLFCKREDEGHIFKVVITIIFGLYMYNIISFFILFGLL